MRRWRDKLGPQRRPLSLAVQYGLATWLVTVITVWGSAGVYFEMNRVRTMQQVRSTAHAIAATAASTIAEAVVSGRTPEILPPVYAAAQQPHVAFVRVRGENGTVMASAGNPAIPPEAVWVESAPIRYFNEPEGTVEIGIYRTAGQPVRFQWTLVAFYLFGGATILSAAISFLVARRTVRPIRTLQEAATRWEEPVEEQLRRISGSREVNQLSDSVLAMRSQALAKKEKLEALVEQRTQQLQDAYHSLEEAFQQTVMALAKALDARDPYTARHSERVADLVERMAERLNCSPEDRRTLVLAAHLHDIGKIGIPESILLKPAALTPEERATIQTHSAIGADILAPIQEMRSVVPLVRHHHERWDGGGYPDGLAGQAIPVGARIIAVADALEAMCSRRPYRPPLPPSVVLGELRKNSGTQFDPDVVADTWPILATTVAEWSSETG